MYQRIKNIKSRSVFSRSGLVAVVMAGVMASPFWLASQATLADEGHHANQDAAASTSMDHKGMSMGGEGMSMGSKKMHESMMKGMKEMQSMPMKGDTDQDFAMMMKKHHQSAVDMAKIEIKDGKDAELKGMAQKIIASQQQEIKQFEQWLDKHVQSMDKPMPKSQ